MLYQHKNSVGQYFFECIRYRNFYYVQHLHRHMELIHVLEGSIILKVNGRTEEIGEGGFAIVSSNQFHEYSTPDHSLVDVCIFSNDHVPFFAGEMRGKTPEGSVFECERAVRDFAESVLFVTDHIPELYQRKAALYAILGEYRKQVAFRKVDSDDEELLDRIVRYVEKKHTENISLKKMAQELGYEPHYISRYFHSCIPMNFSKYVNYYRMNTVNELLRHSRLSITEAALQSGFQSIRTFNRVYRELSGITPKEFLDSL